MSSGGDGAEVIYALRNNDRLSNLILDELTVAGQNARKNNIFYIKDELYDLGIKDTNE